MVVLRSTVTAVPFIDIVPSVGDVVNPAKFPLLTVTSFKPSVDSTLVVVSGSSPEVVAVSLLSVKVLPVEEINNCPLSKVAVTLETA